MDYRVRLLIDYRFDRPLGAGRQLLRVLPRQEAGLQTSRDESLVITPPPVDQRRFDDFFGNRVVEVALPPGPTRVTFDLRARITRLERGPVLDLSSPLAALPAELSSVRDVGTASPHHFRSPSPRIPDLAEIAAYAKRAAASAPTARRAVELLGQAIHTDMTFDPQATEVDTPIATAFAGRRGVCQDFAQIMVAGLRAIGVPAGYVGGFLRTSPPPGKPRLEGADAMHAWVRAWVGARAGWVEYDPTNACFVDADHIAVAHGRDYADAAPVIGQLRLEGGQHSHHSVDILPEPAA